MKWRILTLLIAISLFALPVFANNEGKLNIPALILDIILMGGMVVIYIGHVFAGGFKVAFDYIFIGLGIFAINHLIETFMFVLGFGLETNEIIHRIIHLSGFAFIFYGFYRCRKVISALSKESKKNSS